MARVKSHMIRGQNVSKLTEYDFLSEKYTVTVASGPISSYTNVNWAHTDLCLTWVRTLQLIQLPCLPACVRIQHHTQPKMARMYGTHTAFRAWNIGICATRNIEGRKIGIHVEHYGMCDSFV